MYNSNNKTPIKYSIRFLVGTISRIVGITFLFDFIEEMGKHESLKGPLRSIQDSKYEIRKAIHPLIIKISFTHVCFIYHKLIFDT